MRGKAVPQRVNTDTLCNPGTGRCQANEPVQLARTHVLPSIAGKQPALAASHPCLVARDALPFAQQLKKVRRENDIPFLLALSLLDPDDHSVTVDVGELEL